MANFITKVDAGGLMHTLHLREWGIEGGETTNGPSAKQAQSQMRAIVRMYFGAIVRLQSQCNFQIKFSPIFDPLSHLNEKVKDCKIYKL